MLNSNLLWCHTERASARALSLFIFSFSSWPESVFPFPDTPAAMLAGTRPEHLVIDLATFRETGRAVERFSSHRVSLIDPVRFLVLFLIFVQSFSLYPIKFDCILTLS